MKLVAHNDKILKIATNKAFRHNSSIFNGYPKSRDSSGNCDESPAEKIAKERAQNNLVSFAEANSPGDSKSPGEFARLFCARS